MKAVIYQRYGSSAVLEIKEIEVPELLAHQVLVRVRAVSLNPYDWHMMRGTPFLMRLQSGLCKPKNTHFGVDMAGVVEAIGKEVVGFKVGDKVYGGSRGGTAEFVATSQENIAIMPEALTFEQAAAIPMAAVTALQAVRDKGKVKSGQSILIVGASGGVGTCAVQIAKSFGAEVSGVCSTGNVELVKSLGADHVIDYTVVDFTKGEKKYDVVVQTAGNYSLSELRQCLKPSGTLVLAGDSSGTKGRFGFGMLVGLIQMVAISHFVSQRLMTMLAKRSKSDLSVLNELVESGKFKPVIDRSYPIDRIAEAVEYLETGHARGKVVIVL